VLSLDAPTSCEGFVMIGESSQTGAFLLSAPILAKSKQIVKKNRIFSQCEVSA